MDINQLNPKHMCQKCIDQLRTAMTEQNDQKGLDKLAVIEEGSAFQEKTTGVGLEGAEILLSVMLLPVEVLKERLEEYKKEVAVRKQMQQN